MRCSPLEKKKEQWKRNPNFIFLGPRATCHLKQGPWSHVPWLNTCRETLWWGFTLVSTLSRRYCKACLYMGKVRERAKRRHDNRSGKRKQGKARKGQGFSFWFIIFLLSRLASPCLALYYPFSSCDYYAKTLASVCAHYVCIFAFRSRTCSTYLSGSMNLKTLCCTFT